MTINTQGNKKKKTFRSDSKKNPIYDKEINHFVGGTLNERAGKNRLYSRECLSRYYVSPVPHSSPFTTVARVSFETAAATVQKNKILKEARPTTCVKISPRPAKNISPISKRFSFPSPPLCCHDRIAYLAKREEEIT